MEPPKQPSEDVTTTGGNAAPAGAGPANPTNPANPAGAPLFPASDTTGAVPAVSQPDAAVAGAATPASPAAPTAEAVASPPAPAAPSAAATPSTSPAPSTSDAPVAPSQPVAPAGATVAPSANAPAGESAESEPQTAVIGGSGGRTSYQVSDKAWTPEHPRRGRKKWWIVGGAVVLVLALAGGVFGWYIPSRPENVWATGLSRTGKVVDGILQNATDPKALATRTAYNLDGDVSVTSSDFSGSGKLTLKADEKNSDSSLSAELKSSDGQKLKFSTDFRTSNPKGAQYPDTYFRLNGLKELPFDLNGTMPGITNYDNKWIYIPGTSLARIMSQSAADSTSKDKQLTAQDGSQVARAMSSITRDYIFTANKDKAVIERKSFVGKETVDGVKAYHYTAALNKAHAKAYCLALVDGLTKTTAYEKFVDKTDRSTNKTDLQKGCENATRDIKDSETFDMWIGGKYTLVHKVRLTDTANKKNYLDIGQTYNGGDELPFFVAFHEDDSKTDARVDFKVNSKTYNFSSSFSVKGGQGKEKYDVSGHVNGTATDKPVGVTAPSGAVSLDEVLKALGLPPLDQLVPTPTESI